MMGTKQIIILLIVIVGIVVGIAYLSMGKVKPVLSNIPVQDIVVPVQKEEPSLSGEERISSKVSKYERAKEITAPAGFVNTGGKPIKISDYVGKKVILLDIMTYSCINCIRTFPYIVDWYEKYEDKGLIVIGIHTPEFDFEKVQANVETAMKKYGITFPVVLDNEYGTWSAYKNLYWPRKYLIDIDGFIRYDHIGEGGYAETEKVIQELLKERATVLNLKLDLDMPVTEGLVENRASHQSPETYFGSKRNEYLANGTPGESGIKTFIAPGTFSPDKLYFAGSWDIQPEYAESKEKGSTVIYPFSAKKVFLVMSSDTPTYMEVLIDGKPVSENEKGDDVELIDGKGLIRVSNSRLYSLYTGKESGSHTLMLRTTSSGIKAFAFTFGN